MKIETGNPPFGGRYVAFVPGTFGFASPVIVTWNKGCWHFLHSSQKYTDKVLGWIGPLPPVRISDFDNPEYDL